MANFRYFVDLDGQTIQLDSNRIDHRGAKLGGTFGFDHNSAQWLKVSRAIEYKRQPSKHECDARCIHATGRTMRCECACGGKNHGRGY